jgi:hypothetical protein
MTMPGFVSYAIALTLDPYVLIVYLLLAFFARSLFGAIVGAVAWDLVVQGFYLLNPGTSYSRLVPSVAGAIFTCAVVFALRRLSVAVWRRFSVSAEV